MVKLKNPLLSLGAVGRLTRALTFTRRRKQDIAEKTPTLIDAKSNEQLTWRTMFLLARDLWHQLSAAEKRAWEAAGTTRHMTGYAWFISQALRPNPGLYLPLLGGTMQGDIDMASFKIENLPDPGTAQEPVTKQYFEDNLPVGDYTEGARAWHNAAQAIPHGIWTVLSFNTTNYDTDNIHDPVTNNSRLTCKTAGKYIIIWNGYFELGAGSTRAAWLYKGVGSFAAYTQVARCSVSYTGFLLSTIHVLAVNDYLQVKVHQNSGGALNIGSMHSQGPNFMMQRIG